MTTGESKSLAVHDDNKSFANTLIQSLDHINATNIYSFLKQSGEYQSSKDHFAAYLSGLYQRSANENFHDSLAWFEKIGFLSAAKQESHFRRMKIKVNLIEGAVPILVDLSFGAFQAIAQYLSKKELFEAVVSMLAFVNQKNSALVQARAASFSRQIGWSFNYDNFKGVFEKYSGCRVGQIPLKRSQFDREPGKLAAIVLNACDQDDDKIRERAKELCVFIGFTEKDSEEMMSNITTNAELFSDITGFTGFTAIEIFSDLFTNLSHASEAATFSLDHDPYLRLRHSRKNLIIKGSATAVLATVTFFTGPVGDVLIAASIPVVNSLLTDKTNIEDDVSKSFTIAERLGKLRKKQRELGKPKNE